MVTMNIKDAISTRKSISDCANTNNENYNETTKYCSSVGGKVSTGLMALAALVMFVTSIISFCSSSNGGERRGDNRKFNNNRR